MAFGSPPLPVSWTVLLASLVGFLLQGYAANGASTDHERVLAGAKKEARLVLYTGMDTEEADQYAKEFSKKISLRET